MPLRIRPPSRHLVQLARIAIVVAAGDLASKAAATRWLGHGAPLTDGWLRFAVVHNEQGAFGLSLGAYTWQLNLALTLSAVALMLPVANDLTRVDARAPRALGLIVGGALGNLTSLIISPNGVVDFIALRYASRSVLVLNIADLAAYVGLAMILRTGYLIVLRLRSELREMPGTHVGPPLRLPNLALADREVERAIAVEGMTDRPPARRDVERPASHWPPMVDRPHKGVDARVFDLAERLDKREGPGAR